MLLNFTLAFLLPFNLINRMDISSLYIWGERLSILNSLCPYESCDGALAVCIKPGLTEDRVKKILKIVNSWSLGVYREALGREK